MHFFTKTNSTKLLLTLCVCERERESESESESNRERCFNVEQDQKNKKRNGLNDALHYLISGEVSQLDVSSRGKQKQSNGGNV